ncbi:MAG: ceramide glucosyltransferase [Methylobacteriaceae bacterium]|jgi:ceramide glucosyltransferase|nr:ceramide glucosyltransferase [Methylobacteriaceae bacterium]
MILASIAVLGIVIFILQLASVLAAAWRCRARPRTLAVQNPAPAVSLVRPLCGIEAFSEETLRSTFGLDYPAYEIIFCVQRANDPIVATVERVIAEHPDADARLLIGEDAISSNPKLNNCVKGWNAARHDWIILADSNVLLPKDYIQTLLKPWDEKTGLVISMPIGSRPEGFWAEVECAILNTFEARWMFAGEILGLGFAQGKNMLWRRELLEDAGGIAALAAELAEDAAGTKIVAAAGLKIRFVDMPFEQPLGPRKARDIWSRQVRWARLRRVTFPGYFAPEPIAGAFIPLLLIGIAAHGYDFNPISIVAAFAAVLYGAELILANVAGWFVNWASPIAYIVRDLGFPAMWITACLFDDFTWHGKSISMKEAVPRSG